ncbi:MAG: hypothetical protein JW821_00485, partial [Deltaproteobacteria bacterium]|nr:hypothetical protein [Deltaproteobacteria bacterium]
MDAVMNGTFDAAEMAANAPEALKTFAEENGVDLEHMLEDMAARMEETGGGPPPPPPMLYGADGQSVLDASFEEDATSYLLGQLLSGDESEEGLADLVTEI